MTDSVALGEFVVGEKPNTLLYQFLDSNNLPIDLTGYAATFNFTEHDGVASSATATIADAVNGKVSYTWVGTEFPNAGQYFGQFWVGNHAQRYASVLITWSVRTPVGVVPNI